MHLIVLRGAFDEISDILVLMEKILEDLEERDEETFDDEGNLTSEPTEPIYLLIYGQNLLMEDSRFEKSLIRTSALFKSFRFTHFNLQSL